MEHGVIHGNEERSGTAGNVGKAGVWRFLWETIPVAQASSPVPDPPFALGENGDRRGRRRYKDFPNGISYNIIDNIFRRIIHSSPGFTDFGFVLDLGALCRCGHYFAEEPLVDRAEQFNGEYT